jgi:hypothetical protein
MVILSDLICLMENILKFGFIALALTTFTTTAFAYECNTVMGGCPTDNGQVTSSHMIGSAAAKAAASKPAVVPSTGKNTAAQAGANKKSGQGNLIQTLNKNVVK